MTTRRAQFFGQAPDIPAIPSWLLRLAAPVLLIITLPLAALVFAVALGAAGAMAVARMIARAWRAGDGHPEAAGFGPIIEGEYVVVAERRRPAGHDRMRR